MTLPPRYGVRNDRTRSGYARDQRQRNLTAGPPTAGRPAPRPRRCGGSQSAGAADPPVPPDLASAAFEPALGRSRPHLSGASQPGSWPIGWPFPSEIGQDRRCTDGICHGTGAGTRSGPERTWRRRKRHLGVCRLRGDAGVGCRRAVSQGQHSLGIWGVSYCTWPACCCFPTSNLIPQQWEATNSWRRRD